MQKQCLLESMLGAELNSLLEAITNEDRIKLSDPAVITFSEGEVIIYSPDVAV